ncbi:MAG: hydrolase CocE/NonD family protein [Rhodospirillales bacterium]|nr:hydrolase CocE/NonD family protein [Rhodospirillales bacterium]
MTRTVLISTMLAGLLVAAAAHAVEPADKLKSDIEATCAAYEKTDVMIPMRDGVRLHTEIYRRKDQTGSTAILMNRTPYGIDSATYPCTPTLTTGLQPLRDDGYIVVFQDIRGRFKSEGSFEMLGPLRHLTDPKATDESTDAWDTVDWLVKNVPDNNGKVGVTGVSYGGWTSMMAGIDAHPAVAAVSPQASPIDTWIGDDFWRNGAFRLNYGFEYTGAMELSKTMEPFAFDETDSYAWYLKQGALKNFDTRIIGGRSRFWSEMMQHQTHDGYWSGRNFTRELRNVRVPVLSTAGWWDAEDFYGPLQISKGLGSNGTLVVGPWTHGSWNSAYAENKRGIAPLDFGADTGAYWRQEIQRSFLAHYLLGKPAPDLPRALSFRTGVNQWMRYDAWPPKPTQGVQSLALGCDGTIALNAPPATKPCRASYVSDPANPVPYLSRPFGPFYGGRGVDKTYRSRWPSWEAQDQRFAANRPDTLLFTSPPLTEQFVLTGEAELTLHVTTTGTDGDFIVKLIDIYPPTDPEHWEMAGYQLMLDHVVQPGRYLEGNAAPKKMQPGRVYEVKFHFTGNDHAFLPGHRIALQVQSTLFPVIARNPQTYVDNIFEARDSDFRPAKIEIVFGPGQANRLALPRN